MKAIRFHEHGEPGVLRLEDVSDPAPGDGDLLVRVTAAGITFADVQIRSGVMRAHAWFPAPSLPFTPGFEIVGVVAGAGRAARGWIGAGTRVVGGVRCGGYAELAILPAAAALPVPDWLDDHQALALYGQGATALGIAECCAMRPAELALVLAAAGGVGSLLVQLAKHAGATVIAATGCEQKMALAKQLGADLVVNYSDAGWADRVRAEVGAVHVLFDPVGGALSRAAFGLLADGVGRAVVFGSASAELPGVTPAEILARGISVSGFGPRMLVQPEYAARLRARAFRLYAQDALSPVIGEIRPLSSAAAAHQAFEQRKTVGKVVLVP